MKNEDYYYLARRYGEELISHELSEFDSDPQIESVDDLGSDSESCLLQFELKDGSYLTFRISEMEPIDEMDDMWYTNAKFEIEIGEDYFEEIKVYDYTIKYFWIALLDR